MVTWSLVSLLWLMLTDMTVVPPLTMGYRVLAPAGLFRVWTGPDGQVYDATAFSHTTKTFSSNPAAYFFGPDAETDQMHVIAADEAQRIFIRYGGDILDWNPTPAEGLPS